MKQTFKSDNRTISYEDNPEIHKAVFDKLIKFYKEIDMFSGESICQSDTGYIESPQVVSDIADNIIKFKVKYDDE